MVPPAGCYSGGQGGPGVGSLGTGREREREGERAEGTWLRGCSISWRSDRWSSTAGGDQTCSLELDEDAAELGIVVAEDLAAWRARPSSINPGRRSVPPSPSPASVPPRHWITPDPGKPCARHRA